MGRYSAVNLDSTPNLSLEPIHLGAKTVSWFESCISPLRKKSFTTRKSSLSYFSWFSFCQAIMHLNAPDYFCANCQKNTIRERLDFSNRLLADWRACSRSIESEAFEARVWSSLWRSSCPRFSRQSPGPLLSGYKAGVTRQLQNTWPFSICFVQIRGRSVVQTLLSSLSSFVLKNSLVFWKLNSTASLATADESLEVELGMTRSFWYDE